MCPEEAGGAVGHERRAVDPGGRATPEMVLGEVVDAAVLVVLVLVANCHHALFDPEVLQAAPSLRRDELVASLAPRVPRPEVRRVLLGVGDEMEHLSAQDLVSERGQFGCDGVPDGRGQEETQCTLESDVVVELVQDLGRALKEAIGRARGLREEVGGLFSGRAVLAEVLALLGGRWSSIGVGERHLGSGDAKSDE